MVERVEGFHPELQGRVPREEEVLEETQVQVVDAGPPQDAAAGVAEGAQGGLSERSGVEPLLDGAAAGVDVAHDIGPVGAEAVEHASDVVGRDLEGEAPLPEVDAVDLPAADERLLQSGGAAAHALALAEGQAPDEARHHAMVHVEIRTRVLQPSIVVVDESLPARIGAANAGRRGFIIDALGPGVSGCEQQPAGAVLQLHIS